MFGGTRCAQRFLAGLCNVRCCKLPCGGITGRRDSGRCMNGPRTLASLCIFACPSYKVSKPCCGNARATGCNGHSSGFSCLEGGI